MQWLSYLSEPVTALFPLATVIQYAPNEEDLDTSEGEYSDEDEEGYTTEEEEEDATSEEEGEENEDEVNDEEESEEESQEDEEMMYSQRDFTPPPSLLSHLAISAPVLSISSNRIQPQNAVRRVVNVTIPDDSSDEEDEEDEEDSASDEEDDVAPPPRSTIARRVIQVRDEVSDEDSDDEDDDEEDDEDEYDNGGSSDEEMPEDEREKRVAEDEQRVNCPSTALLGACTICHEDDVVEPTMCKNCKNIVGCYTCVARWMRASQQPKCPLCREQWMENPDRAIAVRLLY